MADHVEVLLFPADKTQTGLFQLARATPSGLPGDWAKADGTFVERWRPYESIGFRTADEAIAWATSAPRRWHVVNAMMFGSQAVTMPRRMTVRVLESSYPPFPHETVQRRKEAGETIVQIGVKFEAIDVQTSLAGCFIVLDQAALDLLAKHGLRRPTDLVGRTLLLTSDDPSDLFRPLRLMQIVR